MNARRFSPRRPAAQLLLAALYAAGLLGALPPVSPARAHPAAPATPGALDPAFGGFGEAGVVTLQSLTLRGIVLQPDGKVVVVGPDYGGAADVRRFLANGQPDESFSGDGQVTVAPPDWIESLIVDDVAVQADGKIVLAGRNVFDRFGAATDFLLLRLTAAGELDTSFGLGGFVVTDVGAGPDYANKVLVQRDGKIVAVGQVRTGGHYEFAAARFNPNGSLDNDADGDGGFSGDGRLSIPFEGAAEAYDAAQQLDGKLIVAGWALIGGDTDFALVRLETDGTLDDTSDGDEGFSGDGKLTTGFGGEERAYAVAVQPDGRIVAAGSRPGSGPDVSFVARYLANGGLDGTFGSGGKLTVPVDILVDVALQLDGKIVLLGHHVSPDGDSKFALHRLIAGGAHDPNFDDGDGIAWLDFGGLDGGSHVALLPDGRILAAGGNSAATLLVRLWPDGLSFDTGGQQAHGLAFPPRYQPGYREQATGLALQPDGALVVAGQAYAPDYAFSQAFVTRFTSQGPLDGSFGTHGSARFGAGIFNAATAVALQSDGKLVVAGYSAFSADYTIMDLLVARFHPDGTPDDGFGYHGSYITDFAGGADSGTALAVAPDGKIVVGGNVWNGSASDWGVLRLTEAGQPDSSFDGDGRYFFGFGIQNGLNALAVQPDGKILAAGHAGRDFAVARLTETGLLDSTFGAGGFAFDDLGGTDVINALALVPDGWLYAAGFRVQGGDADLALAQYTPEGELASCPGPADCRTWPTGTFFVDVGINDYAYAWPCAATGSWWRPDASTSTLPGCRWARPASRRRCPSTPTCWATPTAPGASSSPAPTRWSWPAATTCIPSTAMGTWPWRGLRRRWIRRSRQRRRVIRCFCRWCSGNQRSRHAEAGDASSVCGR